MRSVPRTLLFRTHFEAAELWRRFVRAFPEVVALCLMPDHVHLLLPHGDPHYRRSEVARAYARWRDCHRGCGARARGAGTFADRQPGGFSPERRARGAAPAEPTAHGSETSEGRASGAQTSGPRGPAFAPVEPARPPLPNDDHLRRTVRYIHLNPCRSKLTNDPLLWPWSTHRDHVGFGSAIRAADDPEGQHHYVSADPMCHVAGTPFPQTLWSGVTLDQAESAVRHVLRRFEGDLSPVGTRLLIHTAAFHGAREGLADRVDVGPRQLRRLLGAAPPRGAEIAEPLLSSCITVAGDSRFGALIPLRSSPGFQALCSRRGLT